MSLLSARRYDAVGALMRPHRRASDGALLAEGVASCEGILLYPQANGTVRRELVTRQAVLDTARTVARAPMTLLHPAEGMVTAETAAKLVVGDVDGETAYEEQAQGGYARVKVAVRRQDALDAVQAGTHELSVGYEVTIDPTPGTHPTFGAYDAAQVGRNVNHLALVPRGRAGAGVALRVDDAISIPDPSPRSQHMKPALVQLLSLLGVERFDAEDAALKDGIAAATALKADTVKLRADAQKYSDEYIAELETEAKDAKAALEAMKADNEKMSGELAALKAEGEKAAAAEQDRKDAAELVRLKGIAEKRGLKLDAADLASVRVRIAKSIVPDLRADASPATIDGILLVAEQATASRSDAFDFAGGKPATNTANREDADAARFRDPYLDRAEQARLGGAK